MNKTYRITVSLMAVWLVACIVMSWACILDDALIHLRYADNLLRTHLITYDGVHPNYGVSSLLYVSLLAVLRSFIPSPNLPRGVSSTVHLLLFGGIAALLARTTPRHAARLRLLGLIFLLLLVVPSAIRWLDDGMETGLALCFTALVCWLGFRDSRQSGTTTGNYVGLLVLGFFTVILRTELAMICGVVCAVVTLRRVSSGIGVKGWIWSAINSSHLLLGGLLAMIVITLKMHALLPDTALAKAHGQKTILGILIPAGHALVGGLSFGIGMLLLWAVTFYLVLRFRRGTLSLLMANSPFPLTLLLAGLRGQEIQGFRYLAWTLVFSILWNMLELSEAPESSNVEHNRLVSIFSYGILAAVLLLQPFEISVMYPIMSDRARLMDQMPTQHLDVLQGKRGVAADIGIIGYFTQANICDLAGLVNGRESAQQSGTERLITCAASKPDFLYLNRNQVVVFRLFMPFDDWQVCGEYKMTIFRNKDIHYLIVSPSYMEKVCGGTEFSHPYPASEIAASTPNAQSSGRPRSSNLFHEATP